MIARLLTLSLTLSTNSALATVPVICNLKLMKTASQALLDESAASAQIYSFPGGFESTSFDFTNVNPKVLFLGLNQDFNPPKSCSMVVTMEEPEFVLGCPTYEVKEISNDC